MPFAVRLCLCPCLSISLCVCVFVVGVISCVLLQQNKTTYKYILSANPQWNALRIELVGRQRKKRGKGIPLRSLQFESNCTISCGQKCQREDFHSCSLSLPLSLPLSVSSLPPVCLAFGFWQRLCCLPLALTHACFLTRTFNDTLRLWRLLVLLRFLNAHLARRICCPPWQTVRTSPPLSLPSTPSSLLFRSLLMQFSIALPLFIYCLSMSLSICIVYFRWLMPTTTIRQTI